MLEIENGLQNSREILEYPSLRLFIAQVFLPSDGWGPKTREQIYQELSDGLWYYSQNFETDVPNFNIIDDPRAISADGADALAIASLSGGGEIAFSLDYLTNFASFLEGERADVYLLSPRPRKTIMHELHHLRQNKLNPEQVAKDSEALKIGKGAWERDFYRD